MGAGGDDPPDAVTVQGLDIPIGHCLKQKFIAGPSGRITRATFLVSQDSETDGGLFKDIRKGTRYFLRALVKTSCAAYPEKHFRRFARGSHFSHCPYCHICWLSKAVI